MEKFFDLSFSRQPDGSVRLVQDDRIDEAAIIDAHPEQLLFIARRLCGKSPEAAGKVSELERRIAVLTDKLQSIVCNDAFRGDLIERCGDGFEHLARLDAVLDLALEFNGGRLEPEYRDGEQLEGHNAAKPIYPCTAIDQAKRARPGAIAEGGEQLGLPV